MLNNIIKVLIALINFVKKNKPDHPLKTVSEDDLVEDDIKVISTDDEGVPVDEEEIIDEGEFEKLPLSSFSFRETSTNVNHSSRKGVVPEIVVVHYTGGGTMNGNAKYLEKVGISSHYFISPKGEILKTVDETRSAWTCGKSSHPSFPYFTRSLNRIAISIELVGPPSSLNLTKWPKRQMEALTSLCRDIKTRHPGIKITDHSTISPSRKVDVLAGTGPNKFPWDEVVADSELEAL